MRQRRTIQLRLSSFFPHLVIIQLFLPKTSQTLYIHDGDFFSLPSDVFQPSWCTISVLQKVVECQVGVFDQVYAVFSATGPRLVWATLSPVCTHNVQWSSMFVPTMVLNVLSSSCVAASCANHLNQRYTGTLQLQDQGTSTVSVQLREQGTGTVSVQLEEQHLPLLVGTSEVPPPVQHNAKPGSLCR